MKIQSVSCNTRGFLSPNKSINQTGAKKTNVNSSNLKNMPVYFCGSVLMPDRMSRINKSDYVTIGGICRYGEASMIEVPYNGALCSTFDGITTESIYYNGKKKHVRLYSAKGDKNSDVVLFTRYHAEGLPEGAYNIYYVNKQRDKTYLENYDGEGKLCQTEYCQWDDKDNPICFSRTTYDEDGIKVLGTETRIDRDSVEEVGYSKKVVECKNGKKRRETLNNVTEKDHITKLQKNFFNDDEKLIRTEEDNILFFDPSKPKHYCAKATKRIVSPIKGLTTEYGYRTLDSSRGVNAIRSSVYTERPDTIRQTKDGCVYYYDGPSKALFAVEEYGDGGKLPSCIVNVDLNTYAQKKTLANNIVTYDFYDRNEHRFASMLYKRINGDYIPAEKDTYNFFGRKETVTRYYGNDTEIVSYFADRTTIDKIEEVVSGIIRTVNEYQDKELVRQTRYSEDGSKSVVEIDGKQAVERIYTRESENPYRVIHYKDGIAYKEVIFDEKSGINNVVNYSGDKHINEETGEAAPELCLRKISTY